MKQSSLSGLSRALAAIQVLTIGAGIVATIAVVLKHPGKLDASATMTTAPHPVDVPLISPITDISACAPNAPSAPLNVLRAYLDGATLPSEPSGTRPPEDDAARARGAELYKLHCQACHGVNGDGQGPLSAQLVEKPAMIATKVFELRTTEHEALPTDADLFRTITHGLHNTGMPPWIVLPETDRWALVAHIKTLDKNFADDSAPDPIDLGPVPATTPERIAHGKALFASAGCASCHGDTGRGDGPAGAVLRYADGTAAHPRNLTEPRFHRGNRVADIAMTLVTGLDGTPMASFANVMSKDDIWDVAMFANSISPVFTDRPDGLRCPPVAPLVADEVVGMKSLLESTHLLRPRAQGRTKE